jgi:hypothetical protein
MQSARNATKIEYDDGVTLVLILPANSSNSDCNMMADAKQTTQKEGIRFSLASRFSLLVGERHAMAHHGRSSYSAAAAAAAAAAATTTTTTTRTPSKTMTTT